MKERVQKIIANRGYTSRRKAEELIEKGLVKVNGKVVTELGMKVHVNSEIEVEGIPLENQELVYYLLNKPKDYISTAKDERGRKIVTDLIQTNEMNQRIYPVGRLDRNTTGLLLLTNDGDFMQLMTHPKYEIKKTYLATVAGDARMKDVNRLLEGVEIEKGITVVADDVFILGRNKQKATTTVEITIHDGRYHQVKKMFEAIGYPVKQLKRVTYGHLSVDNMPLGTYRPLKKHEVAQLIQLATQGK